MCRAGARAAGAARPRARAVLARAQQQQPSQGLTRREAALAAAAAVAALAAPAAPALAFLGLGDDGSAKYTELTGTIISGMTAALALDASDPAREEQLKTLRGLATDWVSRYRRDPGFSGRPSFSNLYSAVNALTGQINSFGYTANVPKKRLERIQKELVDADRQLQRGR